MGVATDLTINLESAGSRSGGSLHTRTTLIADGAASIEEMARLQSSVAIDQLEQHARLLKGTTNTNILFDIACDPTTVQRGRNY